MTGNASNAGVRNPPNGAQAGEVRIDPTDPVPGPVEPSRWGDSSASTTPAEPTILVGIPAYNEATSIADIVSEALVFADEVLVVDDGSDDETATRARAAGATVVVHERNLGYGATLETIFRRARTRDAEHLVTMDGDGQHTPADIPKLVATQRAEGAELVVGSRFVDGSDTRMPTYRRFGVSVVNALTNVCMRVRYSAPSVADTQSGFRAYDRDAVEAVFQSGGIGAGMEASLDLLFEVARRGYTFEEVPTAVAYDVDSPSTQDPATHGLALVSTVLRELLPTERVLAASAIAAVAAVIGLTLAVSGTADAASAGALGVVLAGIATGVRRVYPRLVPGVES
jgi:hypothetical protein